LENIPRPLANEWLLDLSTLTESDEDWKKISGPVVDSTKYNGVPFAVPAGQFFAGYFINTDLFKQENLPVLEFGYTLEEFESAVKTLTSINKGTIGFEDISTIMYWYPNVKNDDLGWYTWDGVKYNLDSPEFKEGINKSKEFANNGYVFNELLEEEKQNFKGTSGWETWIEGEVAFKYDGTWGAGAFKELPFGTKFIGLPNSKVGIINDYIGISNSTENEMEAYEFVKWMTFSKEGILKRIELAEASGTVYGSLPLINDNEVLQRYFEHNPSDGIKEVYEEIENGIVEPAKYLPGFHESRSDATTGLKIGDIENATIGDILNECYKGTGKIEDYTTRINELANEKYQEAQASIDNRN
ncbi:MAG: ABC transporter substrate-binding protein, partial [Turicibacter sp.]